MKKTLYLAMILGTTLPLLNSCRDEALEPTLAQSKNLETSINSAEDMRNVLNSAYNRMSTAAYYGRDYIIFGEVRSDNAYSNGNTNRFVTVADMQMINSDRYAAETWARIYSVIAAANVVANIDTSKITGDPSVIKHIKGEALVVRALAHFDLLKLYGQQHVDNGGMTALGVPYVKTFGQTSSPRRNSVKEVYDNAMADLDEALLLMSPNLDNNSKQFLTTNAANAIKARMALYFAGFDNSLYAVARDAALKVIQSGKYSVAKSGEFASTFNTDSTNNQVFSIANSNTDRLTNDNLGNIYHGTYKNVIMLEDLYSKYTNGDVRKAFFDLNDRDTTPGTRYVYKKYPSITGDNDIPIIRYEEVILTYAEALVQTGDAVNALTYLNMIPANRGAKDYTDATLENVLLERRKEFAGEGFEFYDLARNKKGMPLVNPTLQTYYIKNDDGTTSPITYGNFRYAFPIPLTELTSNSNMVQNKGY